MTVCPDCDNSHTKLLGEYTQNRKRRGRERGGREEEERNRERRKRGGKGREEEMMGE